MILFKINLLNICSTEFCLTLNILIPMKRRESGSSFRKHQLSDWFGFKFTTVRTCVISFRKLKWRRSVKRFWLGLSISSADTQFRESKWRKSINLKPRSRRIFVQNSEFDVYKVLRLKSLNKKIYHVPLFINQVYF